MIFKEEVKHIAKLARLSLTEKEMNKFQKDLSAILDYIAKLKKANIEGIEPTSHSVLIKNIFREDKAKKANLETKKKMIEQIPAKKDDYLKVKSIF